MSDQFNLESEGRVSFHIHGEPWQGWAAPRTVLGQPGARMKLVGQTEKATTGGRMIELTYLDEATGVKAVNHLQFFGACPISRRWVTVINDSAVTQELVVLHSAFIDNIPWRCDKEFRLHIPFNHNYAENQWRANHLESLGLIRSMKKFVPHVIVNAIGRSCQTYLPTAVLENTVHNWSMAWQIEHNGSWMWDLGQGNGDVLSLGVGGLSETHNHWIKRLKPGESVDSLTVAVGRVEGDADAALTAMTAYRRLACKPAHVVDAKLPVIFNDYMNCLNGEPNEEKSLPLIAKAAAAGCEIYVIDAGWYGTRSWTEIGNWHEASGKFPRGLNYVMDEVRRHGMEPGLWIEIEAAAVGTELAKKPDTWFLTTRGKRNLFSKRNPLDFRNPDVRRFADETLDRLIGDYGLHYIKFDYNFSVLLGTDHMADSLGDGALEHMRAVQEWYRGLRRRHPEVILENCASGGMRNDYAQLSILQLASSSDMTDYRLFPAIAVGGAAAILPEQLGVWSYPDKSGDRESAVFNMVNALLCRIHQSGRIDEITQEQFEVVQEGISLYKSELRQRIPQATPFWPLGRPTIEQTDAHTAFGLVLHGEKRAYLSVWRLNAAASSVDVPLRGINGGQVTVEQLFPQAPARSWTLSDGVLRLALPRPYTAVLFRLTW